MLWSFDSTQRQAASFGLKQSDTERQSEIIQPLSADIICIPVVTIVIEFECADGNMLTRYEIQTATHLAGPAPRVIAKTG
jgi:hypothetical protein